MKLNYFAETDSLYIDLSEQPSVRSKEISEGVVLDYDAKGNLVRKPQSLQEIDAFLAREQAQWAALIKAGNMSLE